MLLTSLKKLQGLWILVVTYTYVYIKTVKNGDAFFSLISFKFRGIQLNKIIQASDRQKH